MEPRRWFQRTQDAWVRSNPACLGSNVPRTRLDLVTVDVD
ncbi:hypothetical protein SLEP1_g13477 [Rubroshorea leprosula]|uniref:Uncharacterized protein n=1 Tax=Rubroshorea leprosula TaxID=152421 RepID=A0AAV5IG08_9ROSI|nr:hypothetical protein SLEP1_g13477 [Rubroshorea leprosula]